MNRAALLAALVVATFSAAAQERHPLIEKVIELGVANNVVMEKCKGWSLNPEISARILPAIGLAGLTEQFDRIDPAEISSRAERAKADGWTPETTGPRCAELQKMTIPNPLKPGETLAVFVQVSQ